MNPNQRKQVIKDFIGKILTKNLIGEEPGKLEGFKERLQKIIDPNSRKSSYETSLKRVNEVQEQMDGLVDYLDKKMDSVLEKREKEFLSAYQSHMVEVQNELLHLKRKANEKELQLQQDDKILSLEQELAWIREETMKAREEIDNQEALIKDYKEEQQELQDDSRFLKMNLKQLLKDKLFEEAKELQEKDDKISKDDSVKILKIEDEQPVEEEKTFKTKEQEEPQDDQQEANPEIAPHNESILEEDAKSNDSRKMVMSTMPLKTEDVTKIDYILTELFESGRPKAEILAEVRKFCLENQMRRKRVLQLHKRTLEQKAVQETPKSAESQKNLIYFMQCVERVKMEVNSRKRCDPDSLRTKNKVSLFNTSDKRRIMELLLYKENILTKILLKIFRKMKIKDLERKVEYERRASKYHNSAMDTTFKRTGIAQSSRVGEFGYSRREPRSYENSQRMPYKYSKISNSHTPASNLIRYDASAPVHMLNREIDLKEGEIPSFEK
ncbi:unnamed protein product [Moneuplotes crassus]|uniref:Uncharacterized protein n=1 Tax=Euplotes crassus TaxID=5936 RepID=A0AAD1UGW8_EUPCR|nr:unnamed protein product [Moneuplotes crassus]